MIMKDQWTKRLESASPSNTHEKEHASFREDRFGFRKHSESEFAKFRWRLPLQGNFFHREQRIKNWKQEMLFTDLKVHMRTKDTCWSTSSGSWGRVDLSEDPIISGPQSCPHVMNKWSKLFFCFVLKANIIPRLQVITEFFYHYYFLVEFRCFFLWCFSVFLWKITEISCFCGFLMTRVTHMGLSELIWYCKLFWFLSSHDVLIWKALTNANLVRVWLVEREHWIARRKVENLAIT